MIFSIIYFILSIFLIYVIFKSNKVKKLFIDSGGGDQKVHSHHVARSGGLIFIFTIFIAFYFPGIDFKIILYFCIYLTIGLLEDIFKDINPLHRLIAIILFSFICIYDLGFFVTKLEIGFIDNIFSHSIILQLIFTSIALSISINAFNLIDGFNGLMLGISIIAISMLLALIKIDLQYLQQEYFFLILIYFSIISLFLFNFPFGKLFTGDGGAYAIGYTIGIYSIISFNTLKVSPWYFAVILCYPMTEVFISFLRRILCAKKHAFKADLNHLHSLIYLFLKKRSTEFISKYSNPITSIIIWIFYLVQVLPLLLLYDNHFLLKINFLFCILIYLSLYLSLIQKNI